MQGHPVPLSGHAVDRRRDRFPRSGAADRARHGARDADGRRSTPACGASSATPRSAEGSVWEAMANASYHGADNLIAIVDVNRLGQRGPTMLEWDVETYAARARRVRLARRDRRRARRGGDRRCLSSRPSGADRPAIVIAKTEKGHGVSFLENAEGWHGKALSQDEADRAIAELGGPRDVSVTPCASRRPGWRPRRTAGPSGSPLRRGDRDPQGVRRDARRARRRDPTSS